MESCLDALLLEDEPEGLGDACVLRNSGATSPGNRLYLDLKSNLQHVQWAYHNARDGARDRSGDNVNGSPLLLIVLASSTCFHQTLVRTALYCCPKWLQELQESMQFVQ